MSKIKIDKIKLQDLSKDEQRKINGGEANQEQGTITVSVTIVAIKTIAEATKGVTCYSKCECLTANPGHQDSCGLCTTNYHC